MNSEPLDWLSLLLRWFHVIAGITWIGQTYLFNRMEKVLGAPAPGKTNIMGEMWMVHGGGFYLVEKQKWPELMPRELHWFKWESALTWISGVLLLTVVYWAGAPLLEYGSGVSRLQGVLVSAGVLVFGWVAYNAIWRSPLGRWEPAGAAVSWLVILGVSWGLTRFLSDRAAYLHIGAMFGTIMVANVWMVILPNQRKMIAITKAGGQPEFGLAERSKRASRHNTFMSVPVIFTMISSHYPMTFGRDFNWLILGALVLVGFGGAKLVREYL